MTAGGSPAPDDRAGRGDASYLVGDPTIRETAMADHPNGDAPRDNEPSEHPDEQAELAERGDGAHAEHATERDNFRADDTAPGVDPDEGEA